MDLLTQLMFNSQGNTGANTAPLSSPIGAAPAGADLMSLLKNMGGNSPLGMNLGTAQLGLSGLQTLMGLFGSQQAASLAKDQFKHTRDITNTNLTNQIQSYNTALSDRARSRGAMEGRDQASVDRYIEENRLSRR